MACVMLEELKRPPPRDWLAEVRAGCPHCGGSPRAGHDPERCICGCKPDACRNDAEHQRMAVLIQAAHEDGLAEGRGWTPETIRETREAPGPGQHTPG